MLRAITFDGGGIRGLVSTTILQRLIHYRPNLLGEADLLAGTSAGGLTVLSLAAGHPVEHVCSIYQKHAKDIFDRSRRTPFGLFGARYRNRSFYRLAGTMFANKTLGQLGKKVLVPAFNLRLSRAKFFTNWDEQDEDCSVQVRDVAMATSAAPTYFPTWKEYADGGLAANNPSAAAMALLLSPSHTGYLQPLDEVKLLSIGTGATLQSIDRQNLNWGVVQWGSRLVNVFMDGLERVPDYMCRAVLRHSYHRAQPVVNSLPSLDDYHQIDELIRIGRDYDLSEAIVWLDSCWGRDE